MLYHHERYDGTGYPKRLKGDEIPYLARIVSIADAFDAMTTDRIYKKKMTLEEAKEELLAGSGSQFDPKLVDIFVSIVDETWLSQ